MRRHLPAIVGLLAFCACGLETTSDDIWALPRVIGVGLLVVAAWTLGHRTATKELGRSIDTREEAATVHRLARRCVEMVKTHRLRRGLLRWALALLAMAMSACAPTTPLECDDDPGGSSGSSGDDPSIGASGPKRGSGSGGATGSSGSEESSSEGTSGSSGESSDGSSGSSDGSSGLADGSTGSAGCALVPLNPSMGLCICDGVVSDPNLCPDCEFLDCEPSVCEVIGVRCSCDGLPADASFCP